MFKFSTRSKERLAVVHPDLVKVTQRALELSPYDFGITEGLRNKEQQKANVAKGASQTMNSRHLTGHAIDFVAYVDGKVNWDFSYYRQIADAFKKASAELGIPIVWGGDWTTLKDGPHIELDRKRYP